MKRASRMLGDYKGLVIYLGLWTTVALTLFFGIRAYKNLRYDENILEGLIYNQSRSINRVDDPCLYSILGEPTSAGEKYMKVKIFCNEVNSSISSLDMRSFRDLSVGGVLSRLGQINGYEVNVSEHSLITMGNLSDKWYCELNGSEVSDYLDIIPNQGVVRCFYDLSEEKRIEVMKK
jgi:hypothetical protein